MKRRRRTTIEMQHDALACAHRLFARAPLHVNPAIGEAGVNEVFRNVINNLATAWAEGYAARADEKSR